MEEEIVLLDLFSGIGGFAKGLTDSGFKIKKHFFSEIDKHAIACYKYNFKNAEYVGSVTDVRGAGIQRPNIITFGSPCQDFSLAGKRKGMEGERSSLITEAIRLIDECRPDVFIWENVKGTFSSNDGADFWGIIQAFANIGGYRLEWQLLNTSWFLPQNRERIYLIGHLDGRSRPKVFPFREDDFRTTERLSKTPIVRTLSAGGHSGGHHSGMTLIQSFGRNDKQKITKVDNAKNSFTLTQRYGKDSKENLIIKPVLTPDRLEKRQNGRRFKEDGEPSHTLTGQDRHGVMIQKKETIGNSQGARIYEPEGISQTLNSGGGGQGAKTGLYDVQTGIRRLTEQECEILQGFPVDWTKYGDYDGEIKEISMTQRYKMCGNAVTCRVVEEIGKRLLNQ